MSQIIETIDVAVPVSTAYNQWTQFEKFPEFLEHVESITADRRHPHHLAGQYRRRRSASSTRTSRSSTPTSGSPGRAPAARSITPASSPSTSWTTHDTRVTVQLDWEPEGLLEKVGSATGVASHAVKDELRHFKEYIEKKGSADGGWRGDVPAN